MTPQEIRIGFPRQAITSVLLIITVGFSACASVSSAVRKAPQPSPTAHSAPTPTPATAATTATPGPTPVLPGQTFWRNGVSSLLFGTNDSDEYASNNLDTQPQFQQALKSAGVTLIRTFIQDPTTDSAIDVRLSTIENIGAQCLVVIPKINDLAFNEHLVRYIGDRCLMYDFGNEPDWNDISVGAYSKAWITEIPALRQINPHALFFGPVVSYPHTDYLRQFLTQALAANVLPDAISMHWYACYQDPESICLPRASLLAANLQNIQQSIRGVLGRDLPIGIDEWNFDPSGPSPAYGNDSSFVSKFFPEVFAQLANAHVAYACQFDAASYAGYGDLDMFDVKTNQPKPQYYELAKLIALYKSAS